MTTLFRQVDNKTTWMVRFYTHDISTHLPNTTRSYTNADPVFLLVALTFGTYLQPEAPLWD